MKVSADGIDVTERIRKSAVTANVRHIAEAPKLRRELVQMQRSFAEEYERIVTEGRDQGTVAFADADLKFFLKADLTERAGRRKKQLAQNGEEVEIEKIQAEIVKRDASAQSRTVGPLTPAPDAIIIDTTDLDAQGVVEKILGERFVAFGDPKQAIYQFMGANPKVFENFSQKPNTKQLPLSLTYRCSKAITEMAQTIFPDIFCPESEGIG